MGLVAEFLSSKVGSLNTVLELGPYLFSIVKGATTMGLDINVDPDRKAYADKAVKYDVTHDAGTAPWPFSNKSFDLFIGLQVLEHLKDKSLAFSEIRRIADYAAITLPYNWNSLPKEDCHRNINEQTVKDWCGVDPVFSKIIGEIGKAPRLFLFYDFTEVGSVK